MKLRYTVARLVPDLVRDEPINVGIIAQSDEWVGCRFIQSIPKGWGLDSDVVVEVAGNLNQVWTERLDETPELVYLPDLHQQRTVSHTDRAFLEWLNRVYTRHLTFGDIREAEIVIRDDFDYETFLERLFDMFVALKPRPRKPVVRSKLHTAVKHDIKQLALPVDNLIKEKDIVIGSFLWPIDFKYQRNGRSAPSGQEVAIGLVDLAATSFVEKTKDLLATWVDVKQIQQDAVRRVSIVGGAIATEDHRRAIAMLRPSSDDLYLYDREKDQFLGQIKSDLAPLTNGHAR